MRYYTPITDLWSDEHRYKTCLDLSKELMSLAHHKGYITEENLRAVNKVQYCPDLHQKLEKIYKHDIVALTRMLQDESNCPQVHLGVTSSDIVDSAMVRVFNESYQELKKLTDKLLSTMVAAETRHSNVIVMGRTHGKVAEPITWGWRIKVYRHGIERTLSHIKNSMDQLRPKLSGPTGTYTFWTVEDERKWTLRPDNALTTQIIPRDFFARITSNMAILVTQYEKISQDLRLYALLGEYNENFMAGQCGSSSMPHKMNPITLERVSGLAKRVRHNSAGDIENIVTWLERDIAHSSNERLSWGESWNLTAFLTTEMERIFADLQMLNESIPNEAWTSRLLNECKINGLDSYRDIQNGNINHIYTEEMVFRHFEALYDDFK